MISLRQLIVGSMLSDVGEFGFGVFVPKISERRDPFHLGPCTLCRYRYAPYSVRLVRAFDDPGEEIGWICDSCNDDIFRQVYRP